MKKTDPKKWIGLKRFIVLLGCAGLLAGFQNCARASFSTQLIDTPAALSVTPPEAEQVSDIVDISIPPVRYAKLSESPFYQLADLTTGDTPAYANLKIYSPQYPLYSDGAEKRRWIYLPEGSSIDTSNPDEWVFPAGAILYKEFSMNGKKIETRVFEKITNETGFAAWRASVYVWLTNQTDADLLKVDNFYSQTEAEMIPYQANAVASQYRMVTMTRCQTCHASARDVSQGFSYLQLSDASKSVNVMTLGSAGYFSKSFEQFDLIPGTLKERAAIGYIQSNCATCHAGKGPGPHNFKHLSTSKTLAEEPFLKAIGSNPGLVTFGSPSSSRLYIRMANGTMPQVTLYTQDSIGLKTLNNWIADSVMP